MKAIWLEDRQLSVRDLPRPAAGPGWAVVKVDLAGICSTDLELVKGYYPFTGVLGHEFVGRIVETPEAPDRIGQRVVGEINARCGVCSACRAGRRNHCEDRSVLGIYNLDGCFAEYLSLPLENLIPVPESVPDETAVFTEPLAAAAQILQQVTIRPEDRVLVIGAGRLGQWIAQVLAGTGCDLKVVARHAGPRNLLEQNGIAWVDEDQLLPAQADVVVEATGSPAGFESARKAVRAGGTIVMKSTYAGQLNVDFSSIVVDEITIVGSRCGPFEAALRLFESGRADPQGFVTGRFPLTEGKAAMAAAAQPGSMKILLQP